MPGMGTDFFETAAMLITLVLFGKYLETAVSGTVGACSIMDWRGGSRAECELWRSIGVGLAG